MWQRIPKFTLVTGLSLAIGLMIPSLFELSEKPAARGRHTDLERAALITVLVALLIALALWFLKRRQNDVESGELISAPPLQFGIRHILVSTTLIAMAMAIAPLLDGGNSIAPWVILAMILGTFGWSIFQTAPIRSRAGTVLTTIFLPFVWIAPYSEPFGYASGLWPAGLFGPGLFAAMLIRRVHVDSAIWTATVLVALEIAIGIWLARRGGKLFPAYIVVILAWSSFSSMVLHALYRM